MKDGLGRRELLPKSLAGEDENSARGVTAGNHLLQWMAAGHRERPVLVRVEGL